jgi:hypothetical protein
VGDLNADAGDQAVAWYDALRVRYRPDPVRLLLVGESPPDPRSGERRFFYAPKLASADNLYRGVASALYGQEAGFDLRDKPEVLGRMQRDGVWLIDATETPINGKPTGERRRAIREGLGRLERQCTEIEPSVGVLICHAVVFREAATRLRTAGVRVLHDAPLPFPLGNHRARFVDETREALKAAGWRA